MDSDGIVKIQGFIFFLIPFGYYSTRSYCEEVKSLVKSTNSVIRFFSFLHHYSTRISPILIGSKKQLSTSVTVESHLYKSTGRFF
jgi:hypothetical protein